MWQMNGLPMSHSNAIVPHFPYSSSKMKYLIYYLNLLLTLYQTIWFLKPKMNRRGSAMIVEWSELTNPTLVFRLPTALPQGQ